MRIQESWLKKGAFAAIFLGIALRLVNLTSDPALWADEVFSVALAQSPFLDVILLGLRFDTHPSLYYLQLHLWGLLGNSDLWFILNSTLLSLLAGLSVYLACRRIHDAQVALWATALFALLPLQLFFAENVRMYPLVAILQVWLWFVLERRVRGGPPRRVVTVALGLALALSHGLGFFVAFFLFLQALVRMWSGPGRRLPWALVADGCIVALTAIWPLAIGAVRQTEGLAAFDLPTIGIHLTLTLLGLEFPMPEVAGYLALGLLLVPPLLLARSRGITGYLVALPFLVLLVLSLAVKPVFIYRTLGLFLPFLAIGFGLFAAETVARHRPAAQAVLAGVLVLLAASGINYTLRYDKSGYRALAAGWHAQAAPDAVLFAYGPSDYWGITRYLPDVPQASALDVQPEVRGGMLALKGRLEGTFLDRAGFFGQSRWVQVGARRIYPALDAEAAAALPGFWLLNPVETCESLGALPVQETSIDGHRLLECRR